MPASASGNLFCLFCILTSVSSVILLKLPANPAGRRPAQLYVVTVYFQTANIIKILCKIALVCYVGSLYLWIAIELTFGILYSFILNWKINRVYPWLKCSVSEGRLKYPENRIIVRKAVRCLYIAGGMGRTQLLPFLVCAFTSLKLVAYYGNYMLLLTAESVCR